MISRYKYPRTYHLPFSEGVQSDDKMISSTSIFEGKEIIVTEKRDGENTSMYPDGYVHARSIDGTGKEYQTFIVKQWREKAFRLSPEYHICGENLYARHSIAYDNLEDYFEMFGLYEGDMVHSWDMTELVAEDLGIKLVPIIYRGIWDETLVKNICKNLNTEKVEGIVVRNADSFNVKDFASNVAKFVRKNHVQTNEHWTKNWTKNNLGS